MNGDYTNVELDDQVLSTQRGREVTPEPSMPTGALEKETRDPDSINRHLKVDFEEVIAEPAGSHSFDRVWAWSGISFEVCKLWGYRIISLLCALPASISAGCLLAFVTCLHIWCLVPCGRICLLCQPTWRGFCQSLTDIVVAPLCSTASRCLRRVRVQLARH
ncbi:caveolin-2 [Narcine bancroftii]|uniref:caveolin-2 n=1 Tax=Narcine bancroftii TaxID=1343680 RepID=UPI003831B453